MAPAPPRQPSHGRIVEFTDPRPSEGHHAPTHHFPEPEMYYLVSYVWRGRVAAESVPVAQLR
jgi:hypothetical protein